MPVPVDFRQGRGEYFVDCLAHGKPVEGICGVDDLLALAGACLFAARTQAHALSARVDPAALPESVRGRAGNLGEELHGAIDVYAELAEAVYDMWYEEVYEPKMRAVVVVDDGRRMVVPIEGYRADPRGGPSAGGPMGV